MRGRIRGQERGQVGVEDRISAGRRRGQEMTVGNRGHIWVLGRGQVGSEDSRKPL